MPRVSEDGNETSGVPSVQLQAPLGTISDGIRFVRASSPDTAADSRGAGFLSRKTKAERIGCDDPRLSLEERYGTHEGYVSTVMKASEQAVKDRFLLPDDAARFVREAQGSKVIERAPAER